jgi:hypothetical protein
MKSNIYKKRFAARSDAFRRFNTWEQKHAIELGANEAIAAVGNLYELIPIESRHRAFDAQGVATLRRALSRLKG